MTYYTQTQATDKAFMLEKQPPTGIETIIQTTGGFRDTIHGVVEDVTGTASPIDTGYMLPLALLCGGVSLFIGKYLIESSKPLRDYTRKNNN